MIHLSQTFRGIAPILFAVGFLVAVPWNRLIADDATKSGTQPSHDKADQGSTDQGKTDQEAAPADSAEAPPWPTGLEAAKRRALAENRPLLVRVGATWCGPCRKLDQEIANPEVQKELKRWTYVYVDCDASSDEALQLDVSPIPALRVISLRGKVVASHDGFLPADELLTWLRESFDRGAEGADPLLTTEGEPDAEAVGKLIDMLQQQESVPREAAIRRLLPYSQVAAAKTVGAMAKGKLATRLAALELLREWKAPVKDLDPWRPETFTAERQAGLRQWAATAVAAHVDRDAPLKSAAADEARSDLVRLCKLPDTEADALAERLIRLGPALSPLVVAQLKQADTDQARQRLLTLRYRLVATEALALSWPGGLARLAAADVNVRHRAAEELVQRAGETDEPLLLELFSDSDPLVREISLRGLLTVGGEGAGDALVKLLDDPELNVRSAVLKQLAEHPAPELVPKITKYVAGEKDPDLLVHAIRFLKESPGPASDKCLIGLLKHDSWQVRAEAAEALAKHSDRNDAEGQADNYVALIGLLDDSDSFVVSRAMQGLAQADLLPAVEPLVRVATKHPELAAEAVNTLVSGQKMRVKAIPVLRKFAADKEPGVRAAAIKGLASAAPDDCDHELTAALQDESSLVRRTAAEEIWKLFEAASEMRQNQIRNHVSFQGFRVPSDRPAVPAVPGISELPQFLGMLLDKLKAPMDPNEAWMLAYRNGKDRPEWMVATVQPLLKMLTAAAADERLAAALALVPLAHEDQALGVLHKLAVEEPARRVAVAGALPWLPWEKRRALFNDLVDLKPDDGQLAQIAREMGRFNNRGAKDLLWNLLPRAEREKRSEEVVAAIYSILGGECGSSIGEPADESQSADDPQSKVAELKQRAQTGTPAQRTVALALLLADAPEEIPPLATAIIDDPKAAEAARQEALRILLLGEPEAEGEKVAVQWAIGKDASLHRLALTYLAQGREALESMKGDPFYLYNVKDFNRFMISRSESGQPIEVTPPKGLTAEAVRPMLHDADPEIAATAGYLLTTLGEAEGLDPLVKYWRKIGFKDPVWTRMVYRAISVLNDSRQVPLLAEIYKHREGIDCKDFYWTIRAMHGPEILALRKRIRDEIGLENLR